VPPAGQKSDPRGHLNCRRGDRKLAIANLRSCYVSDGHDLHGGIESPKVIRIGRDRRLTGPAGADHNVSIHNIRRCARRKQPSYVGGINPIQSYDIGRRLAKEPGQTRLSFGMTDSLSKSTRGDRDPGPRLAGPGQQHQDSAVVAVNRNQRTGVHRDAGH
jgi:hypothetical protein